MKKGFTLIELLAVIVILAIIALIAVPIVLNIISDVKEKSDEESVLAYANIIEQEYSAWLMKNPNKNFDIFLYEEGINIDKKYKGNRVKCECIIQQQNKIALKKCFVSNSEKLYNYEEGSVFETKLNITNSMVTDLLQKSNEEVINYELGSDESHQMYKFLQPATEQIDSKVDYRYIGRDPYNYVEFNGETWRIIGVFDVENENGKFEKRVKIIRDESLGYMPWDTNQINDWGTASLNNYLNNDYYNSLSDEAKKLIEPVKYYLGSAQFQVGVSQLTEKTSTLDFYNSERSKQRNNDNQLINLVTYLGLMYPSDYGNTYAKGVNEICYNNLKNCDRNVDKKPEYGWLYNKEVQWVLYSDIYNESGFVYIHNWGYIYTTNFANRSNNTVRPVVFLKPNVVLDGNHEGTKLDKYKLKMVDECIVSVK